MAGAASANAGPDPAPGVSLLGHQRNLTLKAAAVEPDVQVETDDTLSLGEDRTVLADNFTVEITRAGIFEFGF